jgi:hypothetical protein
MSGQVMSDVLRSFRKAQEDAFESILSAELTASEKLLRDFFVGVIAQLSNSLVIEDVIRYLETGQFGEAVERAALAGSSFAARVNERFVSAGQATAGHINEMLQVVISFDQVNDLAVAEMKANNLRFIREIEESTRAAIHTVLTDGVTRGLNPRQQAVEFRQFIGLTAKQMQMVTNYRRNLEELSSHALSRALRDRRADRLITRAISEQRPLTPEQIDSLVQRYNDRFIAYRARVIARTEALRAVHQGSEKMWMQGLQSGLFAEEDLIREWRTAADERVRGTHRPMHGQKRPFDQPFVSGAGAALMYPGDLRAPASETIQCRCVVTTRIHTL